MVRAGLLTLANRRVLRRLATSRAGWLVAQRFVAGTELEDGLKVVKMLNARNMSVSLDYLGENVTELEAARIATGAYLEALDRIEAAGLDANVSLKLTQMGLDIDPGFAFDNAARVVERAHRAGTTVTLDMEDHRYTERTIQACIDLSIKYPGSVGVAVQSYLRRTPADVERVLDAQVRLCKGAYLEPREIAVRKKAEVDKAYAHLAVRLLTAGAYPMIATHDERLTRFVERQAEKLGRRRDTFEFQMLYGVRRDLQERLVAAGYQLRVYVPYGTEWYPYLIRRIAERPANVKFFITQLFRR